MNRLKREKKEVSEEEDIHEDDEEEVADPVVTDQPDERPETEEFVLILKRNRNSPQGREPEEDRGLFNDLP